MSDKQAENTGGIGGWIFILFLFVGGMVLGASFFSFNIHRFPYLTFDKVKEAHHEREKELEGKVEKLEEEKRQAMREKKALEKKLVSIPYTLDAFNLNLHNQIKNLCASTDMTGKDKIACTTIEKAIGGMSNHNQQSSSQDS